jgi:hypothetical protein
MFWKDRLTGSSIRDRPGVVVISIAVVVGVILLVLLPAIRRMFDLQKVPWLAWPVMLSAAAFPGYMAYTVLNPGQVYDTAEVRAYKDKFTVNVPGEGYAMMVTALLGPEREDIPSDKTAYTIRYELDGAEHRMVGTIRRKSGDDSIDVNTDAGEAVRETGRRRSGGLGEDLQDRFDLKGAGGVLEGFVANWEGQAATVLILEVIKAPPPNALLWLIAMVICVMAIVVEAGFGADKFTGDIGFLAMYGVFIRDGVTPLDTYKGVGLAVLPAAIVGWVLVAGLGYLVVKYTTSKASKKASEDA